MKPSPTTFTSAFTRLDLLGLTIATGLLALAALPTLGSLHPRGGATACVNNLRQVFTGLESWGLDHQGGWPWRVSTNSGGTLGSSLVASVWYHYSWASNELFSPRVLACPADRERKPASDFGSSPNGGLLNVGFRNNAVSYPIGTDNHGIFDPPTYLLAMDRNVRVETIENCDVGAVVGGIYSRGSGTAVAWTNGNHFPIGNMMFNDGRVDQTTQARLFPNMSLAEGNGSVHLLMP